MAGGPTDEDDGTLPPFKIEIISIKIDDVIVNAPRRPCDSEAVAELVASLSAIGLKTPITVRKIVRGLDPGPFITEYPLVAGLHRLEAARELGWSHIDCIVLNGDETDAKLWEISENLHRNGLNALQHSEAVDRWVELVKGKTGQVVHQSHVGRPEGGMAEAARQLPLPGATAEAKRKLVERSLSIAKIAPEAKEAAIAAGLEDNQQALLRIAKEATKQAQMKMVAELATRKHAKSKPATRKKAKPKPNPKPATPAVIAHAGFRTTQGEAADLQKHIAGIGHRIDPNDFIIKPESESMGARPSEFAILRIPDSHPDRKALKEAIVRLGQDYTTELFFKFLPEAATAAEAGENHGENGVGKGGHHG